MPAVSSGSSGRQRRTSHISQLLGYENAASDAGSSDYGGPQEEEESLTVFPQRRKEGSPSKQSFSSSLNQKTPARSFFHRSFRDTQRQ